MPMQAVCGLYNVAVSDFSTSFADGRVLCLLVRLSENQHDDSRLLPQGLSVCDILRCPPQCLLSSSQHLNCRTNTGTQPRSADPSCPLQVNYYAPALLPVSSIYAPGGCADAGVAIAQHEGGVQAATQTGVQPFSCRKHWTASSCHGKPQVHDPNYILGCAACRLDGGV